MLRKIEREERIRNIIISIFSVVAIIVFSVVGFNHFTNGDQNAVAANSSISTNNTSDTSDTKTTSSTIKKTDKSLSNSSAAANASADLSGSSEQKSAIGQPDTIISDHEKADMVRNIMSQQQGLDPNVLASIPDDEILSANVGNATNSAIAQTATNLINKYPSLKKSNDSSSSSAEATQVDNTVSLTSHVGENYEAVRNELVKQGFNINKIGVTYDYSDTVPTGAIISQDPVSGDVIAEETYINFVVSQEKITTLNDITGYTKNEAQSYLASIGAEYKNHETYEFSNTVDKDKVIRTEPGAGTAISKGTVVSLVYSKGSELD
ncbi:hypothetical protein CRM75_01420 [Enterococcus faecium]|nr:hypothetical protein CRM75_01420 [Enterococcus faecium]